MPATGTIAEPFRPVGRAFARLVHRGAGGGALVVRHRGQVVVDICGGTSDRAGTRPWEPDTLAISFSTTKGIASTVVHRFADRGEIDYDEPVATYWPAFGVGGKERVTVRDLLTHRAGLSSVRAVARKAEDLLDHVAMEERLASRRLDHAPTERSGYHAITYGWLVSGLLRAITGKGMADLVRTEIVEPLDIDGMHLGAPEDARERVAQPVGSALRQSGAAAQLLVPVWSRNARAKNFIDAHLPPGFHRLFEGSEPPIWTTEMPAVNGTFSARALAQLYDQLALGGNGFLKPETVERLGKVQVRTTDAVLGIKMRWRLGYHHAFVAGRRQGRMAFGHYGYGGSGAWADPDHQLAVGFVTNSVGSVSTPLGDLTLPRLNRVIRDCARLRLP